MTSSVTDVVFSPTVHSVYFLTVENRYKAPVNILASSFQEGQWTLRPHFGRAAGSKVFEMKQLQLLKSCEVDEHILSINGIFFWISFFLRYMESCLVLAQVAFDL